jgi:hypothetical protein
MRTLREEPDVTTELSNDPLEDQSLDPGGSLEPDSD